MIRNHRVEKKLNPQYAKQIKNIEQLRKSERERERCHTRRRRATSE